MRNYSSILRISASDALPPSHRDTTLKYAITRSIGNTFPAYSYDKQWQKRHMGEQNKIETRRRNIFLYRHSYTEFKTNHLSYLKGFSDSSKKSDVTLTYGQFKKNPFTQLPCLRPRIVAY